MFNSCLDSVPCDLTTWKLHLTGTAHRNSLCCDPAPGPTALALCLLSVCVSAAAAQTGVEEDHPFLCLQTQTAVITQTLTLPEQVLMWSVWFLHYLRFRNIISNFECWLDFQYNTDRLVLRRTSLCVYSECFTVLKESVNLLKTCIHSYPWRNFNIHGIKSFFIEEKVSLDY